MEGQIHSMVCELILYFQEESMEIEARELDSY